MTDEPLDEFRSETQSFVANPISLADVLALRVPVHWTEAVAVIEELCLVLLTDGEPSAIPEPESVTITAQGTVLVRLGAAGSRDVDAIGRMLNALLDPVTTPIPLRLFVAHSIGSDKYRSLQAFAEGLAYYGRPDRQELIQELYRRCLNSEETLAEEVPPVVPAFDAPITPSVAAEEPVAKKRRMPRWALVAAALLLLLLLVPFVMARRPVTTDALAPVRSLGNAAASAVSTAVQGVQEFLRPQPAVSAKVEAEPVERAEPTPRRRGAAETPGSTPRPSPSTQDMRLVAVAELPAVPGTIDGGALPTLASEPSVLLPVQSGTIAEGALALPAAPAPVAPAPVVRAPDPMVYTSSSLDVQPPVIYSPKLPPLPAADPFWQGTNTMELLIDELGEVRQARLTSRPVRLSDMMLLSPAKTWKFHPALKNGQPVKYRLTMSWVVAPP
jgi:hypothetical protein